MLKEMMTEIKGKDELTQYTEFHRVCCLPKIYMSWWGQR